MENTICDLCGSSSNFVLCFGRRGPNYSTLSCISDQSKAFSLPFARPETSPGRSMLSGKGSKSPIRITLYQMLSCSIGTSGPTGPLFENSTGSTTNRSWSMLVMTGGCSQFLTPTPQYSTLTISKQLSTSSFLRLRKSGFDLLTKIRISLLARLTTESGGDTIRSETGTKTHLGVWPPARHHTNPRSVQHKPPHIGYCRGTCSILQN